MKLVCVRPFGHLKPGDEVEVPDDSGFDSYYFAKAEPLEDIEDPELELDLESTSNAKSKARESK